MQCVKKRLKTDKGYSMDESINQARAIFYDFFAGLFLGDLLEGREALLKTQLER